MVLRNEKTGRFESAKEEVKELTLEEQIKKHEEELAILKARHAEELEKAKAAEEEKLKTSRKEDAEAVKAAITARLEQEKLTRKAKAEAYEVYLEACDEAESELQEKRDVESKLLNDFCNKYGSFHDSITIGDATYTCDYTNKISNVEPFKKLLDFWF